MANFQTFNPQHADPVLPNADGEVFVITRADGVTFKLQGSVEISRDGAATVAGTIMRGREIERSISDRNDNHTVHLGPSLDAISGSATPLRSFRAPDANARELIKGTVSPQTAIRRDFDTRSIRPIESQSLSPWKRSLAASASIFHTGTSWRRTGPIDDVEPQDDFATREMEGRLYKTIGEANMALPAPSGVQPDYSKKVYCTNWLAKGECHFVQQGCRYKHKMPDLPELRKLGFTEVPKWWKLHYRTNSGEQKRPKAQHVPTKTTNDTKVKHDNDHASKSTSIHDVSSLLRRHLVLEPVAQPRAMPTAASAASVGHASPDGVLEEGQKIASTSTDTTMLQPRVSSDVSDGALDCDLIDLRDYPAIAPQQAEDPRAGGGTLDIALPSSPVNQVEKKSTTPVHHPKLIFPDNVATSSTGTRGLGASRHNPASVAPRETAATTSKTEQTEGVAKRALASPGRTAEVDVEVGVTPGAASVKSKPKARGSMAKKKQQQREAEERKAEGTAARKSTSPRTRKGGKTQAKMQAQVPRYH